MKKNTYIIILISFFACSSLQAQELFQELYEEVVEVKTPEELVEAVNNGKPNDFIRILPGVYKMKKDQQLKPKQGMTITGSGLGMTTLTAADDWDPGLEGLPAHEVDETKVNTDPYLFKIENTSDVKILNMTMTAPKLHGAIYAFNCQNLEFFKMKFHHFRWSSIYSFDITHFKVHNCLFYDAGGRVRWMGAAIFSNRTTYGEFYNNKITSSPDNNNFFVGFKARGSSYCRIHHNTVHLSFRVFAFEYMHSDHHHIEIDHNNFNSTMSLPGHNEEKIDEPGFYTFWVHHNYLSNSYAIESARSYMKFESNYFDFPLEHDGGHLYTEYARKGTEEHVIMRNNQMRNPGRALIWSAGGAYKNYRFENNHVKAHKTLTPRTEGLIHFVGRSDFETISIRDNIIECIGLARPMLDNDTITQVQFENNLLINISDTDKFENKQTTATQGLINPLRFKCGYKKEYVVDGWDIVHRGPEE